MMQCDDDQCKVQIFLAIASLHKHFVCLFDLFSRVKSTSKQKWLLKVAPGFDEEPSGGQSALAVVDCATINEVHFLFPSKKKM